MRMVSSEDADKSRLASVAASIDALPAVAFLAAPDGSVTHVSIGWERFVGNRREDMLGDGYASFIHPDDLPRAMENWLAAMLTGESYRDECRIRFGDGTYRWVSSQADPFRNEANEVVGWCGIVTDVHDRRVAQDAADEALREARDALRGLEESEERYRLLSHSLPGTTWTATPDGRLDHISRNPLSVERMPVEAGLGRGWLDGLHPDDRDRVEAAWNACVAAGEPYDVQFRLRMAGGEYRWQLVRAQAQRDELGEIIRWVGVNVDIDDYRRADEARERFVALVENCTDLIGMTDPSGMLTYLNPAARSVLSVDGTTPLHFLECFAPEDREVVSTVIVPAVEDEGRATGEFMLRNLRSGASIPIAYSAFALTDQRGERIGLAAIGRDLRERQRIDIGMRALAEAGAVMYSSLDYEETLRNIAEAVMRTFATFCTIDVVDGSDGGVRRVAIAHPDPGARLFLQENTARRIIPSNHPVMRAILTGSSTLITEPWSTWTAERGLETPAGVERLAIRSLISVPVRTPDGSIFGALTCCLDGNDPHPTFVPDDVAFAEELGRRAGIAVEHARAYQREHAIAVRFQEASLPGTLPVLDDVTLSADYRPGNTEATIGGDWYDAFALEDGRLVITIGDVLGKGLDAAVTMAKLRQAMRSAAALLPDPIAMLTAAEHAVYDVTAGTYATALAAVYDPRTHELAFASAGHPGPMVLAPDGTLVDRTSAGAMLGLRPGGDLRVSTFSVPDGSVLVFFTDGLTEATHDIEEGYRRLREAVAGGAGSPGADRARELVDAVLRGASVSDDVAVLVAEIGPRFTESWRLPARIAEVTPVRHAIRDRLAASSLSETDRSLVELAAGELISNAVEHGGGGFVDVTLQLRASETVLVVRNEGSGFVGRDVDFDALGLQQSGRGLALLRAFGFDISIECPDGLCGVTARLKTSRPASGENRGARARRSPKSP